MPVFPETLSQDQSRLHRLESARRRNPADAGAAAALATALAASQAAYRQRRDARPDVRIDADLPVGQQAERLIELIRAHRVLVVAGETGSGKTTQLPKLCLLAGRGSAGMIGCTQPRRIAARAVAKRVAEELQCALGTAVGYQVRFNEQVGERTYLKFMTDGILLAEIAGDPWLSRYDTLIIDEVHERSLNIDFLLGYLKDLLRKRHDLKLVITSATIDTGRIAAHFGDAPVLVIEGRSHPVEVRYREYRQEDGSEPGLTEKIAACADEITATDGLGDILVFLPGEREIREAHRLLEKRAYRATEVIPLYARLSARDQDRVFQPGPGRRIVLATNVAETSLTVPRIKYVIDPGLARIKRYSPRQKMDRLQIEPVSQASAEQRKGRCGRVSAGICYRLYAEADFLQRPAFTDPEIRRASLAGVILRMLTLKLGVLEKFPLIDMPDARAINDGWQTLAELGAIDSRRQLTAVGAQVARLPVDVKLARMLVAARGHDVLQEILAIAAFMGIGDPRERPADHREAADNAHRQFADAGSEFLGVLRLWQAFRSAHEELNQNQLRRWCDRHFLSYLRMREWRELHRQLLITVQDMQWQVPAWPETEARLAGAETDAKAAARHYQQVHRAVLAGLPTQIGRRHEKGHYEGPRQRRFQLFPASPLAKQPPPWCLVGGLLDTGRVWGLMAAKIDPDWVIGECAHLLSRHYYDARWSRRQGRVTGLCQTSLFGLVLAAKQPVHYGALFAEEARSIFIEQALLTGEIDCRAAFVARNRETLQRAMQEESKRRRTGLVVDEQWQARWYQDRIPAEINSADALDKWHRQLPDDRKAALLWRLDDLMLAEQSHAALFPAYFAMGRHRLALHYRFSPGQADDGVNLDVPIALLNALDDSRLGWLVPGLVEEKVTGLIRGLPKALRRNYVPAPDFARAFCQAYPAAGPDSLPGTLAKFLTRTTGAPLSALDFDEAVLDPHLRINLRLHDGNGQLLAESRDLTELKMRYTAQAERAFSEQATQGLGEHGLQAFPAQGVPARIDTDTGLVAYPCLQLADGRIRMQALADPAQAAFQHDAAVRHLLLQALADKRKSAARQLPVDARLGMLYATLESAESLRPDCVQAACNELLARDLSGIRSLPAFESALKEAGARLFERSMAVLSLLQACLQSAARIRGGLDPPLMGWASANLADIRARLGQLVQPGFLSGTPPALLAQLPRYLQALEIRLGRALQDPLKDQARMLEIRPFNEAATRLRESAAPHDTDLAGFLQEVEELNVQVFAQELALKGAVSAKRLAKKLAEINSRV